MMNREDARLIAHRSMLRIFLHCLVTTLSILSLLLCLATVTLWVRSFGRFEAFTIRTSSVMVLDFASTFGRLRLARLGTTPATGVGKWSHNSVNVQYNPDWPRFWMRTHQSGDW